MPHNWCSMPIRHSSERERIKEGGAIPRIKERKVTRIPINIGALGTTDWRLRIRTEKLQTEIYCNLMQETCLFGTANIIRKILDT